VKKLLLYLALAVACGGAKEKKTTVATVDPLQDLGAGIEELRRDLESTVLENYSHLSLGNIEAYADSVADDGAIALIGPRPRDLVVDGMTFRDRRDRRMYRERDVRIYSKKLEMHLSEDGSSAWVADELSYRVPYADREAALALRYTAMFVRRSGRWEMVGEHMSYPLAVDRAIAFARAESFPKLRKMGKNIGKGAEEAASVVRRVHAGEREYRERHVSASASSLWWLPDPSAEYRGEAIWSAPGVEASYGSGASLQRVGIVARAVSEGTIAWVAEHLFLRARAYDDDILVPLRALYVLERTGQDWQIVQAHLSVPLDDEQLNELIFGKKKLTDRVGPGRRGTAAP
jgi:hypothetical protein